MDLTEIVKMVDIVVQFLMLGILIVFEYTLTWDLLKKRDEENV